MIVLKDENNSFSEISGNPVLTSLDGSKRSPLRTIMHNTWTDEDRAEFGIYYVNIDPPTGYNWSGQFVEENGYPTPVYNEISLSSLKETKKSYVKDKQSELFLDGWTHEFSVGVYTLDLRNADDKANWTLLLIKTQSMVASGAGAYPVDIRTATDEKISVPASEVNSALGQFLTWGENMLKKKWDLDDLIDNAITTEELNLIDIDNGWPQ